MIMKMKIYQPLAFLLLILGCSGGNEEMTSKQEPYQSIAQISAQDWERLSTKKIYFGHKSVGFNILDGIKAVMEKNPQIKLNIVETSDLRNIEGGCFAHSPIGQNVDPVSKINAFSNYVETGIGNIADIAFFKFCYVDIHTGTDLEKIFSLYKEQMSSLEAKYQNTRFIHVTVPLTANPSGIKGVIKKAKDIVKSIVGKINMYDNSVKRDYNEKVRNTYSASGNLYDLAKSESTFRDGRALFEDDKKTIQTLIPQFSNDGGHLNDEGKYKVAEELLVYLVNRM